MIETKERVSKAITIIFFTSSIFLFAYTHYKARFIFNELRNFIYFKYYVFSIFNIVFWGSVYKLEHKIRVNIILASVSLLFSCFLVEAMLMGTDWEIKKRVTRANRAGIEFDGRTKIQVVQDLIKEGGEAVPSFHTSILLRRPPKRANGEIILPLGGISKIRTVFCNEGGEYSIYESDRYGFNNPDIEWDKNKINWLIIGDSYAHGACVEPGNDIAGWVRKLTSASTISLGIGGNGPLIELASLTEYGESIRPEVVFWFYTESNDANPDLELEKNNQILRNYLQPEYSQNLIKRQGSVNEVLKKYLADELEATVAENTIFQFRNIRRLIDAISVKNKVVRSDTGVKSLFAEIILKAKDRVEAWGGKFYFVYLPSFESLVLGLNLYGKHEVLNTMTKLNISVIDLQTSLSKKCADAKIFYPLGIPSHFNSKGYKEIAKAILSKAQLGS